jgi:hypothetical protein
VKIMREGVQPCSSLVAFDIIRMVSNYTSLAKDLIVRAPGFELGYVFRQSGVRIPFAAPSDLSQPELPILLGRTY